MTAYRWAVCEYRECQKLADYRFTARWSIADFDDFYACLVHVPNVIAYIERRTVDGLPVQEIEQRALPTALARGDALRHWLHELDAGDADYRPPPASESS